MPVMSDLPVGVGETSEWWINIFTAVEGVQRHEAVEYKVTHGQKSNWLFQTCSVSLSSNHYSCPLVSSLVLLSFSVCLALTDFLYLLILSHQFPIRENPVTPGHMSLTSGLCLQWVRVQLAYHRCFLAPAPLSCDGNINIWPDTPLLSLSLFPAWCYGTMAVKDVGTWNPSVSAQAVSPTKTFTIG